MTYAYLRVSTDEQDVNSQRQSVEALAKDRNLTIDEIICDEGVSGTKQPEKRNLGKLLDSIQKGDIIIASEISRLGRDLYMVMDILHKCMEKGCVIYTYKDNFVLGKDLQSKVLAFAFGLAAEIERQMIAQRTKEGLRLRMKMGILVGRPQKSPKDKSITHQEGNTKKMFEKKDDVKKMFEWGVPINRIAQNFGVNRNSVFRILDELGLKKYDFLQKERESKHQRRRTEIETKYKDTDYCVMNIDRDTMTQLIMQDLTIPEIHSQLKNYTYEQIYDTILVDYKYNKLYRQHGQKKIKKVRN